ncbi:MAG: preprotein translocase subunit YajC [Ferruginibacter sp.]|nr:preprotein translocase subunit YajC [Cytophagales bacterium]
MLPSILLQASGGSGALVQQLLFFGAIFLVFYFFFIRPQQTKQKEQKKFREALKKGDQVVTIGGLHGRIYAVEGDQVVLEVDRSVKLTFERTSIAQEYAPKATPATKAV